MSTRQGNNKPVSIMSTNMCKTKYNQLPKHRVQQIYHTKGNKGIPLQALGAPGD